MWKETHASEMLESGLFTHASASQIKTIKNGEFGDKLRIIQAAFGLIHLNTYISTRG